MHYNKKKIRKFTVIRFSSVDTLINYAVHSVPTSKLTDRIRYIMYFL